MGSLDLFPFDATYVDNLEKRFMQSRDLSRFMWSEALSLLEGSPSLTAAPLVMPILKD